MKRFLGRGLLITALATALTSPPLSGYVLHSPPVKWGGGAFPSPSVGNVYWYFHESGTADIPGGPLTLDGEYSILTGAMQDWESATGGNLDLEYAGTIPTLHSALDGVNTVQFTSSWSDDPSTIAITWLTSSGSTILQADIEFNDEGWDFSVPSQLRGTALHEFGHAFGLNHSSVGTIMSGIYSPVVHDLTWDDVVGIQALYGIGKGSDGVDGVPPEFPGPPVLTPPPTTPPPPPPGSSASAPGSPIRRRPYDPPENDFGQDDEGRSARARLLRARARYCIVATAAYGSADATRVDALRALRDRDLRGTPAGKSLVSLYEQSAAPLAQVVKKSEVLRTLVRQLLSR